MIKQHLNTILRFGKILFIGIVICLIGLEFIQLKNEISWQQLQAIIESVGALKIGLLIIIALLALTPMLNYDFIFNRALGTSYQKHYILVRSVIINTLNNMIGFGGFINLGLRMHYFSTEHSRKNLLKILLKSYLFYFSGCSLLALIGFLYILFSKISALQPYLIWLLVGILYYPVTILISRYKEKGTSLFSWRYAVECSVTSIFEWGFAFVVFSLVGWALHVQLPLLAILTVFIIAYLFGLASMMPGALGSFDFVVLSLFTQLGLTQELVLSWLLLYRLCYYIVPFFLGTGVLVTHSVKQISVQKNEFLKRILKSFSTDALTIFLYALGIFILLSATIPEKIIHLKWLSQLHPIHANLIYQFPSVILGFSFILLGRANRQRVKRAYWPTLILLGTGWLYCILVGFGILTIVCFTLSIVIAINSKKQAHCEQLVYSLESFTKDFVVYASVTLLAVIVGTHNYSNMYLHHRFTYFLTAPFGHNLIHVCIFLFILFSSQFLLWWYLKGKQITIGETPDFKEMQCLIEENNVDNSATLVYLGDKQIFPYRDEEGKLLACVQFFKIRDKLVVMGEPFGEKKACEEILPIFLNEANKYGYNPVFYEISRKFTMHLHDYGFNFIKFGETAYVDLKAFDLQGSHNRNFRNVLRKFEKNDITFDVLKAPVARETMRTLREVSDKWLAGRAEKGFSLGFFKEDYLKRCDIAVVKNAEGKIIAFASLMPNRTGNRHTVDLMRLNYDETPNSTMDFLFLNLLLYSKEKGKAFFDLGMAPLSNVGVSEYSFIHEKTAFLVYNFGERFYSFRGLRTYKQKFAPAWVPMYTSFNKRSWLIYTMVYLFFVNILAVKNSE